MREQLPRQQRAVSKNRIRKAVGRDAGQIAKEQTEDHHHEERLNDGPRGAQYRLLVAHLDVAPNQKVKQLAVLPKFLQPDRSPSRLRPYEKRRQGLDRGLRVWDCGRRAGHEKTWTRRK